MNKKTARASDAQYEPLTTPQGWTGDEKRFALRLTQLMDELFAKMASVQKRILALEKQLEKEETNG